MHDEPTVRPVQSSPPVVAGAATLPVRTARWSRRRLLIRLAAALGTVASLGVGLGAPAAVGARELGLPRRACACGGTLAVGRTPGVTGAEPVRQAARPFENRVGWAYSPRWRKSRAEIVDDLQQMRDLGCNTVYVGHNSAGNTDPDAYEPGLAPANWYAIAAATASAESAQVITRTIDTTLDAAREVGLDAVLGIGYQIMM